MPPPPEIGSLSFAAIEALVRGDTPPPVDRWHPPHCGDSMMRIDRDGRWWHEGAPIERPAMVQLFSSILRREADGGFVLVTPHEKLSIAVEDAPFVAQEVRVEGSGRTATLAFRLNTGAIVIADRDHPIRLVAHDDGERPYLGVRPGLEALIARSVYYELADLAVEVDGLWSAGTRFTLEPQP